MKSKTLKRDKVNIITLGCSKNLVDSEVLSGQLAANAANNHTVDWWRFDAFAEYKLTDNVELRVSGLNLTNELYYDAIYQAADSFAFVAPGRAGYLTIKVKY